MQLAGDRRGDRQHSTKLNQMVTDGEPSTGVPLLHGKVNFCPLLTLTFDLSNSQSNQLVFVPQLYVSREFGEIPTNSFQDIC